MDDVSRAGSAGCCRLADKGWHCARVKALCAQTVENARRPDPASAVKMSQILRRICVYKYKSAAALFGIDWIEFLNRHSKVKISGKAARLLLDALYMNARLQRPVTAAMSYDLYRFLPQLDWRKLMIRLL